MYIILSYNFHFKVHKFFCIFIIFSERFFNILKLIDFLVKIIDFFKDKNSFKKASWKFISILTIWLLIWDIGPKLKPSEGIISTFLLQKSDPI